MIGGNGTALAWALLAALLSACGRAPTLPGPIPTPTSPLVAVALSTPVRTATVTRIPAVAAPATTPFPTATPIIYVVEPGDTLLAIAAHHGVALEVLQLMNPDVRPELLQIGQRLVIPASEESTGGGSQVWAPTPVPLVITRFGLYETPVGGLWGLGEVANQTDRPVENVLIEVTLYLADGAQYGSLNTWAARGLIPPGETSPFGVLFQEVPADPVNHRISLLGGEWAARPEKWYLDLAVADENGGPVGATYRVTGVVRNSGGETAEQISLLVTLYDAAGQVTGFRKVFLPDALPSGAETPFDIRLSPGGPGTEYHTVAVSGRRSDSQ